MVTIVSIARLVLCKKCGWHGRIMLPDGTSSEMFATREGAQREVEAFLSEGKITPLEAECLVEEIGKSRLFTESEIGPLKDMLLRMIEESDHSPSIPDAFPAEYYDLDERLASRKRTLH